MKIRRFRWSGVARQACFASVTAAAAVLAHSAAPNLLPTFASTAIAAEDAAQAGIPLKRVVMFSSGVSFFERDGKVEGDAKLNLQFKTKDVNDLLKSMVLEDLGGGQISTVTYGSKDPITRTLQTFAIDLTKNPTLASLLAQVRGEKIEIDAPTKVVGTIIGVERKKVRVGKDETVETDFITLLTEEGLRSISLDNVGRIKLLNPKLDAELRQALTVLAMSHSTDKKSVTLNFTGKGARPVRVGYIQESPIWKTSYRLVLGDDAEALMQGWAIVENTTEEDWKDVKLSLVSGRPISFTMDLYESLFINRPEVKLELYSSLRPRTYDQDMAARDRDFRRAGLDPAAPAPPMAAAAPADRYYAENRARKADGLAKAGEGYLGGDEKADFKRLKESIGPGGAVGGDVGELFQYNIAAPVTLERQRSAMLPIVNQNVQGKKVSIYNPSVHAKHPLNGLRLKNTTQLHLMQGPITVFDGGAYAGDAQIQDLQPGTERLVSYAMDLDTEVAPTSKGLPETLVSVRIAKGVLFASRKYERVNSWVIKNSGKKAKDLLIEFPLDTSWTLVSPKEASEKTRDLYRFAVNAEPGKPANLEVKEERTDQQAVYITNMDDQSIQFYINQKVVSEKVKDALKEIIKRKQAIAVSANKRGELQRQIDVIFTEQNRIRQNMAAVQKGTDLYNRYVKKFNEQEDAIEKLREETTKALDQENGLRQQLDTYLLGLELS